MAYQLNILPTAQTEADIILDYLSMKSKKAAETFFKDLHKTYLTLQEGIVNYGLSRFPDLALQGYHSVIFNNYVLLYLEEENVRTVVHIFHQKQDYANLV